MPNKPSSPRRKPGSSLASDPDPGLRRGDKPRIWTPQVTVAAIMSRDARFLLVEEEIDGELVYNQPAGHWEPGETLVDACAREALEETAYPFVPRALVGIYRWRHAPSDTTFLRFAFCGDAGERDAARAIDADIRRAVWLTLEEIRALQARHRSPLVMACIEDYSAGKRYPLQLLRHYE